jgi:DNA-directed RNA polymerase sigma subunit (sigma70/sigma32)
MVAEVSFSQLAQGGEYLPQLLETNTQVEKYANQEMQATLKRAMMVLTSTEMEIVGMRHGFNDSEEMTFEEIGRLYNMSREGVRRIYERALFKLRRGSHRVLEDFLDSSR